MFVSMLRTTSSRIARPVDWSSTTITVFLIAGTARILGRDIVSYAAVLVMIGQGNLCLCGSLGGALLKSMTRRKKPRECALFLRRTIEECSEPKRKTPWREARAFRLGILTMTYFRAV